MNTLKQQQLFFNTIKEEYKYNCIKQGFCGKCKYNTASGDRLDCFEKFYFEKMKKVMS